MKLSQANQERYRHWQTLWFQTPWFSRIFVSVMKHAAKPIYQWASDLMRPDLQGKDLILADIGCGNGLMVWHLAQQMEPSQFYLSDISASQLTMGQPVFDETSQRHKVQVLCDAAEQSSIPDQQCDVVISTGSINLWSDPVQGLQECQRILKPGGVLWVFDQEPCVSWSMRFSALLRQRVFGLGIPGYTAQEVIAFAKDLPEPQVYHDQSLYGLRWKLPSQK